MGVGEWNWGIGLAVGVGEQRWGWEGAQPPGVLLTWNTQAFPPVVLLLCGLLGVTVRILLRALKFLKVTPSLKMVQQMSHLSYYLLPGEVIDTWEILTQNHTDGERLSQYPNLGVSVSDMNSSYQPVLGFLLL